MRNRSKYPFTLVWIPENALCPPVRYIPSYWALQFQTVPKQHYLWFNLVWLKKKKRKFSFSPHKAVWTILMHKGVPWRLQLSLSVQTPLSFHHHACTVPCCLGNPTARPLSLCGYTGTSVRAPEQLKKDSLRLCREKKVHACPFLPSPMRHVHEHERENSSTHTE